MTKPTRELTVAELYERAEERLAEIERDVKPRLVHINAIRAALNCAKERPGLTERWGDVAERIADRLIGEDAAIRDVIGEKDDPDPLEPWQGGSI